MVTGRLFLKFVAFMKHLLSYVTPPLLVWLRILQTQIVGILLADTERQVP